MPVFVPTWRRSNIGFILFAVIIALTGCSPVNEIIAPNTTSDEYIEPDAVKARIAKALDEAQVVLGGTWVVNDRSLASGCGNTNTHYMYSSARYRNEPAEDFIAVTAALKQFWEAEGLEVQEISYAPSHRILATVMPWGDQIDYLVDDGTIMLSADTTCYPGNWAEIRQADGEALRNSPSPAP